ncbi:hypothetical protein POVWA1_006640 [Plasmodium ovale wallikeri]|uniref:Uncharacterized protein n=1 Tax=Plasmodium ovale wallikeri TaxID=864142 RepID=A0A1A8YIG3_PLAOA|nr:hypothetical protein POVWA1_006640 [Plasmodium ovale wallikeri]
MCSRKFAHGLLKLCTSTLTREKCKKQEIKKKKREKMVSTYNHFKVRDKFEISATLIFTNLRRCTQPQKKKKKKKKKNCIAHKCTS